MQAASAVDHKKLLHPVCAVLGWMGGFRIVGSYLPMFDRSLPAWTRLSCALLFALAMSCSVATEAWATCGDWLDSSMNHEQPTAGDQADQSQPSRPCQGPHCSNDPVRPLAPGSVKRVSIERWAQLSQPFDFGSNSKSKSLPATETAPLSPSADRLFRPPRS